MSQLPPGSTLLPELPHPSFLPQQQGYRRNSPGDLRPRLEAGWRRAWNETEFVSGDGWVFVDLHWHVYPRQFPFRVDLARLWSRPGRVVVEGREVRVFPAEELVGLLCLHGAKDTWLRLIWLCDVDRLIRASPALDWERVRAFSEESRCRRVVGLALLLAHRLFGTPLPTEVSLGSPGTRRWEGLADRHGAVAPLAGGWTIGTDGALDLLPLAGALADTDDAGYGAALFHSTLAAALAEWVRGAARSTGLRTVALGGGCFMNRILATRLHAHLERLGLTVLEARQAPPNDGGLALGQAAVARAPGSR